ncbi:MAG: hypothetical protein FD143_2966, partial [Ignavibacteria bacterium]
MTGDMGGGTPPKNLQVFQESKNNLNFLKIKIL